jgi:hypothetical protein
MAALTSGANFALLRSDRATWLEIVITVRSNYSVYSALRRSDLTDKNAT